MKLKVNEIFTTFQGEGRSIGMPCTFLRLAVCNLHCRWCDTWYTWNFGKGDGVEERHGSKTVRMEDELHEQTVEEVAAKLIELGTKNLVISGGEPMLQQAALIELLELLAYKGDIKWVEVETNGTVPLVPDFEKIIQQINCSPKLESSGNIKKARYRPEVLKAYQATGKAVFKFVVTSEADLQEIHDICAECDLTDVMLMPQGKSKEEQEQWQEKVAFIAREWGVGFSPRLHILVYGTKRGV